MTMAAVGADADNCRLSCRSCRTLKDLQPVLLLSCSSAVCWISLIIVLQQCIRAEAAPQSEQTVESAPEVVAPACRMSRGIFPTLWGGAVTAAALAVDMWADAPRFLFDIHDSRSPSQLLLKRILGTFFLLWLPLYRPMLTFKRAIEARILLSKAQINDGSDRAAKLNILVTCTVWLALPKSADGSSSDQYGSLTQNCYGKRKGISEQTIKTSLEWPCAKWNLELLDRQQSTAQERGAFPEQKLVWELSLAGKLHCLESGLQLPHIEELEALQTKTGLATAIAALQAAGYLLGIMGRLAQRLEISPVEAIATAISILVLCQAALHKVSTGSCRRPLILHLSREAQQNQRLMDGLTQHHAEAEAEASVLNIHGRNMWIFTMVTTSLLLLLSGLAMAYAVHFLTSSSRCLLCSLSAFFFQLSILNFFAGFIFYCVQMSKNEDALCDETTKIRLYSVCAIPMVTGYILALVATVLEWDRFNVEGNSIYEWILPYIG